MPHAALWVVQRSTVEDELYDLHGFNAARGFVGGAAKIGSGHSGFEMVFQCRTRLCGWCSEMV